MRNIFLFIRRYSNFFIFLFLQVLSLWFLFTYNRTHRATGLGIANEFTGWVNSKYNKIEDYFKLNKENQRLNRFNDSLLNLLPGNFSSRDTSVLSTIDSLVFDTTGRYRRYIFRPAKVVYNTVSGVKNYIQVNRGSAQGIKDNMAVISSDGYVVGLVVNVSANFSQVMSLLHVQSIVSASLKKTGDIGDIQWDGKDPRYLIMKKVPKTADLKKGDTILTSPVSFNYPPGYMIGTVADFKLDNTTGMYSLKVKTAANFYDLQQVHVIENTEYNEQTKLNTETKKKIEQLKNNPR
ncbi:MAG: rod shape-determining protein MreC [Chitinophagaceae bacterium]|nr:rod shape-determining protein MreC [Chitinophagaceae bacterium]